MSDILKRLEDKIDKIDSRLDNVDITLAKQSVVLEVHVKRTNLLEEAIKPLSVHVSMINGALKLLGVLAMVAAIVEAIMLVVHK